MNVSETNADNIGSAQTADRDGGPMNYDGRFVATMDALRCLGFESDTDVYSEGGTGLSFDFGNFKLSAGLMMSIQMQEVVCFSGVVSTSRTIASIEFEMPVRVESHDQCSAWIAWYLNAQMPHREKVILLDRSDFLNYGMQHFSLLPWERSKAAYASHPRCSVERTWMRQGLNSIQKYIDLVEMESKVIISFDGNLLLFQGENWVIPLPATGAAWSYKYQIEVRNFSRFPSRLMNTAIEVSIWDGSMRLGNRFYRGVTGVDEELLLPQLADHK